MKGCSCRGGKSHDCRKLGEQAITPGMLTMTTRRNAKFSVPIAKRRKTGNGSEALWSSLAIVFPRGYLSGNELLIIRSVCKDMKDLLKQQSNWPKQVSFRLNTDTSVMEYARWLGGPEPLIMERDSKMHMCCSSHITNLGPLGMLINSRYTSV